MEEALSAFRILASEFSDVSDEEVIQWMELTAPMVSKRAFGNLYAQALALLTAHRMKLSGMGAVEDSYGGFQATSRLASYSEGGISVSYRDYNASANYKGSDWSLTSYGQQFASLAQSLVIPIRSAGEA